MSAPSSAILAEIYLQYIECFSIYDILQKHKIIGYFRYVDDILLVYNEETTNINLTLQEFNKIHPKLIYTIEKEENNKIHFLDIIIQRTENKLTYGIHRKATATDTIIHNESCHPTQHKITAINYMINRLNTYPLSKHEKNGERDTIKHILEQNQYQLSDTIKRKLNKENLINTHPPKEQGNKQTKNKWATFTYFGHEVKKVTNVFKNTTLKIAYRTTNNIQKHIQQKQHKNNAYEHSGVYRLKCKDCPFEYIGQTGRSFNIRYKNT
jgi:hypothetical protein